MVIEINPLTPAISVKVISFFEISFVTRKIVSGTARFCSPPPLHLFCPRYDQIPAPCPPPRLSYQNCFLFFFICLFQSVNSRTTVKPVFGDIVSSTCTVLDAIFPWVTAYYRVDWIGQIYFVLTSSIKPRLYPLLSPSPLISLLFP